MLLHLPEIGSWKLEAVEPNLDAVYPRRIPVWQGALEAERTATRFYVLCILSSVQANSSNHDWKLGCMGEVVLEERLVRGRRHGHAQRRTAT